MVMRPEPWGEALDAVLEQGRGRLGEDAVPVVLVPTPSGRPLTQRWVRELAVEPWLVVPCGRYEGIDERFIEETRPLEVSLGDYVISGGELAAIVLMDAVVRLLPGALGHELSAEEDSFAEVKGERLLDCPHYTRPEVWNDQEVPAALLSGHHSNIERWRRDQRLRITAEHRPELIEQAREQGLLNAKDEGFLAKTASKL